MKEDFIEKIEKKVRSCLEEGGGHSFDHVYRVCKMAEKISEGEDVDMDVVRASALLHDVARPKEEEFDVCHAEEGAKMALEILKEVGFPSDKIDAVVHAILVHRYSKRLKAETREAEILQDADRLDALGAVTIARIFSFGGLKRRLMHISGQIGREDNKTSLGHFYKKNLKIKPETFKTPRAQEIAKSRYEYIKEFVDRFEKEWEGEL
jgi:uncharacterized protein